MKLKGKLITAITASLYCFAAHGQDTTITIRPVTVISDYVPFLADAVKEATPPVAEAPDAPLPKLSYAIIPVQFRTTSRLDIPKALEMNKNTPLNLKNNHVRLGFGNYASPLAELYLHNRKSEYGAYGLTFKHLSANGPDNAKFADNNVSLFGKRFFRMGTLFADFDYTRNGLRYYGYDRAFAEPGNDSLKQVYNTFAINGGWESSEWGKRKMQFSTTAAYYNISDQWGAKENDATVQGTFKTLMKKDDVLAATLAYNYSSYTDSLGSIGRHFVHLQPRYRLKNEMVNLDLGFNGSMYKDSADPKFYFFPVIEAEYMVDKDNLSAIAGITGQLQKNTLRGFVLENPFMGNRNTMVNTVNRFELYFGLKGKASANFGFTARVYYNQFNDLAVYVADSSVLQRFKPLYIDAHVWRFNAELAYHYSEKVRINLTGNFYNYKVQDAAQKPWQLPTAELKLNTIYNIGNKLLLNADVFVMNKRPAIREYTLPTTELKAFADFNVGLEYRYRKTLSLFLRVNNISSVRYQRWYNYPVLGLNVLGGITFSL